jgi:ADP-ribosylglycohydrolase
VSPQLRERITGALLGVHAGDSLGASCEFQTWEEIRRDHPDGLREIVGGGPFHWAAGHATDDTDLTRALLLAHLDPGPDVVVTAGQRMLDWYHGHWPGRRPGTRPVDIGGATRTGLLRFERTGDPRSSGAGPGQAGNGSLMRCIPTALAEPEAVTRARLSRELSGITHNDVRCTLSCVAYNEIVVALLHDEPPAGAVAAGLAAASDPGAAAADPEAGSVGEAIRYGQALSLPEAVLTGQTSLPDGGGGFVLDSLSIAVAALLDRRPAEDVLVDVVRLGRDTDSNAAIAGGLLGARDGVAGLPERWLAELQFAAEFTAAGEVLAARW